MSSPPKNLLRLLARHLQLQSMAQGTYGQPSLARAVQQAHQVPKQRRRIGTAPQPLFQQCPSRLLSSASRWTNPQTPNSTDAQRQSQPWQQQLRHQSSTSSTSSPSSPPSSAASPSLQSNLPTLDELEQQRASGKQPQQSGEPTEREPIPEYMLQFTCKKCMERSSHRVSKQAYHGGTVLVQCPGCKVRHLVADHLGIFSDQRVTLEDIMAGKGETIRKGRAELKFKPNGEGVMEVQNSAEGTEAKS